MILITNKEIPEKFLGINTLSESIVEQELPSLYGGTYLRNIHIRYISKISLINVRDNGWIYKFIFIVQDDFSTGFKNKHTIFDEYYKKEIPKVLSKALNLDSFTIIEETTNTIVSYEREYVLDLSISLEVRNCKVKTLDIDISRIPKDSIKEGSISCNSVEEVLEVVLNLADSELVQFLLGDGFCIVRKLVYMKDEDTFETYLKSFINTYLQDNKGSLVSMKDLDTVINRGIITIERLYSILDNRYDSNNMNSAEKLSEDVLDKLCRYNIAILDKFDYRTVSPKILEKYIGVSKSTEILNINPKRLTKDDLFPLLERINEVRDNDKEIYSKRYMYEYTDYIKNNMTAENAKRVVDLVLKSPHLNNVLKLRIINKAIKLTQDEEYFISKLANSEYIDYEAIKGVGVSSGDLSADDLLRLLSRGGNYNVTDLVTIINKLRDCGLDDKTISKSFGSNMYIHCENNERDLLKGVNFNADEKSEWLVTTVIFDYYVVLDILSPDVNTDYLLLKAIGVSSLDDTDFDTIYKNVIRKDDSDKLLQRLTVDMKKRLKLKILKEVENSSILSGADYYGDYNCKFVYDTFKILNSTDEELKDLFLKLFSVTGMSAIKIGEILGLTDEELEKIETVKDIIYPTPKYNWLRHSNTVNIHLGVSYSKNDICNKIKADSRYINMRVVTSVYGIKDGRKIFIDTLSKWLFGVSNIRGNLVLNKSGDKIFLPSNTPEIVINLIRDTFNVNKR